MRLHPRLIAVTAALGLAGVPAAGAANPATNPDELPAVTITPEPAPLPPGARIEDERNTIAVLRASAASAVFVTQQKIVVDYYAGKAMEVPSGSGSGFVWDDKGHIVTNYHVVKGAKTVTVTLQDQRRFPARLVGMEPRKDIAVLKIDAPAESLVPVRRHPEKSLAVEAGQKVIAIGNPFGLDHTVTTGIVSALGREVEGPAGVTMRDMVQTDAAINPGNSGGPLLDSSGRLIGMNTAIYSRSGAWAGIGFAVPADTISRIVPQLIRNGKVQQIGFGVQIDPTRRIERRFGIRGVAVLGIVPGSPAEKLNLEGLRRSGRGHLVLGDVIVGVEGKKIDDYDDLYNALDGREPGETIKIAIVRGERQLEHKVSLIALD